jgi:hypothetical protein
MSARFLFVLSIYLWIYIHTIISVYFSHCQVRIAIGDTSSFLVATEEGELVFCDWGSSKKADDDEAAGPRKAVKQFIKGHYATPVSLQRSPHFADMFLTVGDWSFHIWKAGVDVRIRARLLFIVAWLHIFRVMLESPSLSSPMF